MSISGSVSCGSRGNGGLIDVCGSNDVVVVAVILLFMFAVD